LSAVKEIVEFWKVKVAPLLGIPFAVKLALNQMKSPPWIGVPLKFEEFVDCAVHGGGGAEQFRLLGEKLIGIVFNPTKVADPENVVEHVRGPSGWVSVVLKVPFPGATKEIEFVMVIVEEQVGMTSIE
jgi:hypothetical protein